MRNIDIYWFSGTGNTLILAKEMKLYFEKLDYKVKLFPIEKTDPKSINTDSIIGIAVPVAMQGTYGIVWDFIKNLPEVEANNTYCFFADSLSAYSGGLLGPVKKILQKKGYTPLVAHEFIMPSNYGRDKRAGEIERQMVERSKEQIDKFCLDIHNKVEDWKDIPVYSDLMSGVSRSKILKKLWRKVMRIRIDESRCINCNLCVKICPVSNFKTGSFPKVLDKCILCQRCIAYCPKSAISCSAKPQIQYRSIDLNDLLEELGLK